MSKESQGNAEEDVRVTTVDGIHGEITDSSSLFTVDKGQTYKEFWSNVSESWEDAVFAVVGTPFDRNATPETLLLSGEPEVKIMVEALRLGPDSSVLEIGAGVGRLAYHIAPYCERYVGADISPNMLEIAAKTTASRNNTSYVELKEAEGLPFPDESFDAVYSQAVFIHLDREDCYRYIQEAFRVLKPGGRAYFQVYNLLHPEGFSIFDWVARYTVTPQGKVRGRVHFLCNVELREYVEKSGFKIDEADSHLQARRQDYPYPIPMLNYDYYLIATGEKPGRGADLLGAKERVEVGDFSEEYCKHYVQGFIEKVGEVLGTEGAELTDFLTGLAPQETFNAVIEIERAVRKCSLEKRDPLELIPAIRSGIDDRAPGLSVAEGLSQTLRDSDEAR